MLLGPEQAGGKDYQRAPGTNAAQTELTPPIRPTQTARAICCGDSTALTPTSKLANESICYYMQGWAEALIRYTVNQSHAVGTRLNSNF